MALNFKAYNELPKPCIAIQVTKENIFEVSKWCDGERCFGESISVNTLSEPDIAYFSDWIVRKPTGELAIVNSKDFPTYYREVAG